jgi:hypothetical protein
MRDYLNTNSLIIMKEILETKLQIVIKHLEEADYHDDILRSSYYEGQKELLEDLINQCAHIEHSYDQHDYYNSHFDEDYSDPIEDYYSDLAMYKHEEISDMYNKHYHFSWWISKNVLHTDSMWFTSDEIEAFRIIWQRRISAV